MRAKILVYALPTFILTTIHLAEAQPGKIPWIGYLAGTGSGPSPAFIQGLRDLSYVEGKNIAFVFRTAEGHPERYPDLATELVRLKVDIIVADFTSASLAAKKATSTIPIIMASTGADPVVEGFVASFARPGRNITGLTNMSIDIAGKRLELLKEAVPKVARVAVLYDPANPGEEVLPVAAGALGLTLRSWGVRAANDFDQVFAAISKWRPDGLSVPFRPPLMRANEKQIVGFALKSRLPSMYSRKESVDAGGLMSYGADEAESYRRVAYFVDRILKGAKPADLPVEQPTKFELVINLKTAKQIGLRIPQSMLYRADKVIK